MDLTEEEAERLFPDDRGDSIDKADVEPYMSIRRGEEGWLVEIDAEVWSISSHQEPVIAEALGGDSIWMVFEDVEDTITVLDRNT